MSYSSETLKHIGSQQSNIKTCLSDRVISILKLNGILRKKKKCSSGARSKVSAVWYNVHGQMGLGRNLPNTSVLARNSVVFLSESWLVETKAKPLLNNKDFFIVHAEQGQRGRPHGGIEAYISRCLKPVTYSCFTLSFYSSFIGSHI